MLQSLHTARHCCHRLPAPQPSGPKPHPTTHTRRSGPLPLPHPCPAPHSCIHHPRGSRRHLGATPASSIPSESTATPAQDGDSVESVQSATHSAVKLQGKEEGKDATTSTAPIPGAPASLAPNLEATKGSTTPSESSLNKALSQTQTSTADSTSPPATSSPSPAGTSAVASERTSASASAPACSQPGGDSAEASQLDGSSSSAHVNSTVASGTLASSTATISTVADGTTPGSTVASGTSVGPAAVDGTAANNTVAHGTVNSGTVASSAATNSTIAGGTAANAAVPSGTAAGDTVAGSTAAIAAMPSGTAADSKVASTTVPSGTVASGTVAGGTDASSTETSRTAASSTEASKRDVADEVDAGEEEYEEYAEGEEWEEYEEGEFEEEEEEYEEPAGPYTGPTEAFYEEGKYLEVGGIANAHGVKGEVKVFPVTDSPRQRFKAGSRLWLQPFTSKLQKAKAPMRMVIVESGRPSITKKGVIWLVKFKETPSRTEAESLKRSILWVARSDLPAPKTGELYLSDIVGMKVLHQGSQEEVGEVVDVFADLAPYETIRVKLTQTPADIQAAQYRSVLIPLVPSICPVVDGERRCIELDAPEGLLDLVSVTRLGKKSKKKQDKSGKAQASKRTPQASPQTDASSQAGPSVPS